MSWVRRGPPPVDDEHVCPVPMRRVTHTVPAPWRAGDFSPAQHVTLEVDGRLGDVWRCDGCAALWSVDLRWPARGFRPSGLRWVPAGPWLRFRYRHAGRPA